MERVVERGEKGGGGEIGLAATRTTMTGFRMGEKGGGGMLKYKINILNPA